MDISALLLLVEDEAMIALALSDALEEAGFAVEAANTAEAAISALEQRTGEIVG